MENIELQKIWKTIDNEIDMKDKEELNLLLRSKARQTMNKFLIIMSVSVILCVGMIAFLIITSLERQDDLIYLINNTMLGIFTIITLTTVLFSWIKFRSKSYNQPLKKWLDGRIKLLSKYLSGKFSKLYLFIIPLFFILTLFSIHVYFENITFMEVLNTEESVVGLIVALPIGLFVSYYTSRKIRKYQLQNLGFLKDLRARLCNMQ
ncbi:MAG: hypothetical protein RQ761_12455 [Bacteroidales bacterium]|nr:hypothetical protein [Bacteroidales bacterium]